MSTGFQWASPLGFSVVLFILSGVLWVVIGVLTPLMLNAKIGGQALIITSRTDAVVFGGSPADLLQASPALAQLRTILLTIIGGLLVAAGSLFVALAWFGVRQGQTWALGSLTLAGIVVLPFWLLVLWPYFQKGAPIALIDVPPFMWVPAALLIPAAVMGWIGLR